MIASAGCIGPGNHVLDIASEYAAEREVFGRPIGKIREFSFRSPRRR
jgi:alkylation response protein AidB-like acyl-CoA dehydrogenase